jgi:hypothetical protein
MSFEYQAILARNTVGVDCPSRKVGPRSWLQSVSCVERGPSDARERWQRRSCDATVNPVSSDNQTPFMPTAVIRAARYWTGSRIAAPST